MPAIAPAGAAFGAIVTVPLVSTCIASWFRSRSQVCIAAISSLCALMMRPVRRSTAGDAPWVGAQRDM